MRENLVGIALVFRFGNPSQKAWSEHEKKTLEEAQKQEEQKVRFGPNEARGYFQRCGVSVMENVCPPSLEERIVNRVVEIILQKQSRKRALRSSKEQPFYEPPGVGKKNREIYLVTTRSCKRMKEQEGKPFDDSGKVAWAVEGQDIKERGSESLRPTSSLESASGGICMPDAEDATHSQNLDNPANRPFLDMLDILTNRFGPFLSNENEDDAQMFGYDDNEHTMMCLQLILAEKNAAKGERGSHQDMWATTGAAIIGVSLLNDRAMDLCHGSLSNATFSLPRRSAYVLSGAARYGTSWRELRGAFKHELKPFVTEEEE